MSYNPNFAGSSSAAASQAINTTELNNTGSSITKLTPVRINSSGNIALIDVAVESEALAIAGLTDSDITNSSSGNIVNSGKIKNITTTAVFGDILFLSKTGDITNIKPSIGVGGFLAGDFVVKLGIVAKNADVPTDKDLIVHISIVGQL
jgi:hypothetical protein